MRPILVFDLDGTLIHSAPDLHRALSQLFAEETLRPHSLEQVTSMVGDGAPMLVMRAFEHAGRPAGDALPRLLARFLDLYETGIAELTLSYPGVPETLARLRDDGYRMAVCTNKPDGPTRIVLDALGLASFFDVIVGGDSAPAKKPDGRHLLAVLDRMQASPQEAIMIGDGTNDLLVAEAVGVPSIFVRYGYGLRNPPNPTPAAIIDAFEDLPAAIARIPAEFTGSKSVARHIVQ